MSDLMQNIIAGYRTKQTTFALTGAWSKIAIANPRRWSIIFATTGNATISLSGTGAASDGIVLPTTSVPLILNVRDHASLPMMDWYGFSGALASVCVIEVSMVD